MSFYLEEEIKPDFDFDYEKVAKEVVEFCLSHENFPYEAEINLTLTDDEGIHKINKQFRNIDRATDVLSFPMLSYDEPGDFSFLSDENEDDFNPDTGEVILGDIIISVDKVREQAENYGHSKKREFAFLITHSMLHLFGYDHMQPDEALVMEKKQHVILDELNIPRQNEEITEV